MTVEELRRELEFATKDSLVYIEGVGRSQQTLLTEVNFEFHGMGRSSVILSDFSHEKASTS